MWGIVGDIDIIIGGTLYLFFKYLFNFYTLLNTNLVL